RRPSSPAARRRSGRSSAGAGGPIPARTSTCRSGNSDAEDPMLKILGYPDRYSVAPRETIAFKLSPEEGESLQARLVGVVHADANPEGPGLKFRHIPSAVDGRHPGRRQRIDSGSCMVVDPMPALLVGAFTFFAMIWPTRPSLPDQTILAQWDPARQA